MRWALWSNIRLVVGGILGTVGNIVGSAFGKALRREDAIGAGLPRFPTAGPFSGEPFPTGEPFSIRSPFPTEEPVPTNVPGFPITALPDSESWYYTNHISLRSNVSTDAIPTGIRASPTGIPVISGPLPIVPKGKFSYNDHCTPRTDVYTVAGTVLETVGNILGGVAGGVL